MSTLGPPTTIRLPLELHARLAATAAARSISMGELIREQLNGSAPIYTAVDSIQRQLATLERSAGKPLSSAVKGRPANQPDLSTGSPVDPGVLLEILLVLRQLAPPQKLSAAHAEAERLGVTVWKGDAA